MRAPGPNIDKNENKPRTEKAIFWKAEKTSKKMSGFWVRHWRAPGAPESKGKSKSESKSKRASKVVLATRGPKSTKMKASHERKKQFFGRPKKQRARARARAKARARAGARARGGGEPKESNRNRV